MSSKNALAANRSRSAALNPHVGAGGAAMLLLAMIAALVAITGDAGAGAPSVRVALTKIGAVDNVPAGWREALVKESPGEIHLGHETLALSEGPVVMGHEGGAAAPQPQAAVPAAPGAQPVGVSLAQSPIAGLWSPGPGGAPLPIVAGDGRTPAQAYARPFVATGAPKVALVVGGMGLNAQVTRHAIEVLPPEVTLAFAPYAEGLQGWIDMARSAGHEVLLEAPMEPGDYPVNDPGPFTLLIDNRPDETVSKLEWVLSRATGYFGVTNYLGARFVGSDPSMAAFSGALTRRGVAFVDDGLARGRPGPLRASADRAVDDQLTAEAIARQFAALEATAFSRGQALGSGFAYPVTVNEATRWARSVSQRGLQLAPASALLTPPVNGAPSAPRKLAQNAPRTAH